MTFQRNSLTAAYRWPRRHEHVVEALPMLSAAEVLSNTAADRRPRQPTVWRHATWPGLVLLTRREGCTLRTWLVCPGCRRPRGALYRAPEAPDRWRCRGCIGGTGAVYASQRVGRRHPLRRVETPRKAAIRSRREAESSRVAKRLRGRLPAVPPSLAPLIDRLLVSMIADEPDLTPATEARLLDSAAELLQELDCDLVHESRVAPSAREEESPKPCRPTRPPLPRSSLKTPTLSGRLPTPRRLSRPRN